MSRKLQWKRIKSHRSYTLEELATLIGCHRNTARAWMKHGLRPLNDGRRPLLFHGGSAKEFLKARRAKAQRPCRPHEMFCFKCKTPRELAGSMADFRRQSARGGVLAGMCVQCSTLMFKRTSTAAVELLRATLDIKITGG